MTYPDKVVLAFRHKVCDELEKPSSKKAKGELEDLKTGGRCCLGHMSYALGCERVVDNDGNVYFDREKFVSPKSVVEKLKLNNNTGYSTGTNKSLSVINDNSKTTPQEIGAYLRKKIMGGEGTPWEKIELL